MTLAQMAEFNRRSTAKAVGYGTGVTDDRCPRGCGLSEFPTDRRVLWSLESTLAVAGGGPYLGEAHDRLLAYLRLTCPHHWHVAGDRERQCFWCNVVEQCLCDRPCGQDHMRFVERCDLAACDWCAGEGAPPW